MSFSFFSLVPWARSEEVEIRQVAADKGTNVTIPCGGLLQLQNSNVQWVYRGNRTHHQILVRYLKII